MQRILRVLEIEERDFVGVGVLFRFQAFLWREQALFRQDEKEQVDQGNQVYHEADEEVVDFGCPGYRGPDCGFEWGWYGFGGLVACEEAACCELHGFESVHVHVAVFKVSFFVEARDECEEVSDEACLRSVSGEQSAFVLRISNEIHPPCPSESA